MADTNAVGGLKWVKDEIVASLWRVRERLEDFVEHGPDLERPRLREAVTALVEVRGVLSALQLIGPARLTNEMQALCEALVAESTSDTKEASEALMLALIQLPDYLERIGAGQADVPVALLPSINDLRATRGAAPMSETELLVPTTLLADAQMPSPDAQSSLRQVAGKVRPHFHQYLLQWFRGETSRQGLADLGRLFHQLQEFIREGLFHDLFLTADAVVEALLEGSIAEDAKSKALIAHLDRVIKPLAAESRAWPQEQAHRLLFELLSSIAHCRPLSPRIGELIASYGLDQDTRQQWVEPVPMAVGPGPEAIGMLVSEARKELLPIKDALDLFARSGREDREQLLRLETQLRNLATTLSVTGATDLVGQLHRCGEKLEEMGLGEVPTDDLRLMAVAEELLSVEVALGDLGLGDIPEAEREEARALVAGTLREVRVDIARAEQAISEFVDSDDDQGVLKDVPNLFRRVAGALRILSENDAAQVLDRVLEQIEQRFLKPSRAPDERELDLLAQAISGIDLYLAGMSEGEPYRPDLVAEARRAVDELRAVQAPSLAPAVEERQAGDEVPGADAIEIEKPTAPASGIDPDFLDIFLEEAREEERTIGDQFARWRDDEEDEIALTTLRRSFHTLKGSGRLVGALRVGELARAVEMLLNRVIDGTLSTTPEVIAFVADAVGLLPELIAAEASQQPLDVGELVARAESLVLFAPSEVAAPTFPAEEPKAAKVIPWPTAGPSTTPEEAPEEVYAEGEEVASDSDLEEEPPVLVPDEVTAEVQARQEEDAEIAALATADDELLDIFRTEVAEHLGVLQSYLARLEEEGASAVPDEPVIRALHTLTGSARMTGVESTAKVTAPLERLFLAHQVQGTEPDPSLLQLLGQSVDALEMRLEYLPGCGDELAMLRTIASDLEARLTLLDEEPGKEALTLEDLEAAASQTEEEVREPLPPLAEEVVHVEGEAHASERGEGAVSDEDTVALEEAVSDEETPAPEIAGLATGQQQVRAPDLAEEAVAAQEFSEPELSKAVLGEEVIAAFQVPEETISPAQTPLEQVASTAEVADQEAAAIAAADSGPPPQDSELISLFLEDARDLVDRLDQSLRDLQLAPTESGPLGEMQRSLHTLKGSARLSGLAPIGDLSHAFESLLIAISHGEAAVADDTLELAQRTLDTLSDQIDAVERDSGLRRANELIQALALALEEGLAGTPDKTPQVAVIAPSPASTGRIGAESAPPVPAPAEAAASAAVGESVSPQIRVRLDLIDRLVNNAGEISIYRSRLAQQSGSMTFRLGELERTVERLRGQLRSLEMETEAQILHRYERDSESLAPGQEGFDPLELDRFSTLQQLSRSLAETVNDLVSLRTLLRDLQSESDTLLQQQARISNDLQDGLLRTRMVPFVQAVPRLHRVVRQTAQQMGKQARLEVFGPEVELDRGIQERILAPLEHLLRNAVAHGIEPPEQRGREGKSPAGVVSLVLNREGNDVVIRIADDGAGLNLQAIRRRALEKGLIAKSAQPGDDELTGLILESGFSTVDEVSQIAGRGVGLDVVNTEVKQLSGSFSLETQPGRGTSFTIRLPLTLAIIEALLVQLGDQIFAIPHATVEAASRIARADLDACYQGGGRDFSYGGHDFRVAYLGSMLRLQGVPELGERRWLPVLLARSGEQRIAFHVEQLLGSQRIVVKPLGPELSNIRWLSGGTILADGRVAMIVDLLALLRSAAIQDYRPAMQPQPQESKRRPSVLVVDDSLTVRRVTSRMLQRQNMDVTTAQDGIDALTRLEERVPDVILLDIEMPRMDGYELTRHIRRSERLKEIPLIMITSRTGEKHRRHALELGVDRYLGKPYQEADLLDEISSVLVEASL